VSSLALTPAPAPVSALTRVLAVLLALLTLPPTLAGVVAGVLWLDGGSATVRHTASAPVGAAPAISVRMVAGVLTVRQGPAGRVSLVDVDTVHGLSRGVADNALRRLASTLTPTSGGAEVSVPAEYPSLQDVNLGGPISENRDVTISIPPGASLRLDSGPGLIRLADISGPVDVSGSAGLVVLQSFTVAAASRIHLTNGGIAGTVTMAGGSLDAAVVSGGIKLILGSASADGTRLQATTANGAIDLPRDFGLSVQQFGSTRSSSGVIGGGRASSGSLTLDTVNGVISLSRG
jgi:hypothetical protein